MKSPIKWHGGKSYLSKWIIDQFPSRMRYTHYCEPFAGSLSVLFQHNPDGKSEVVNDMHSGLMDFWYCLQKMPHTLIHALTVTPLSQSVFEKSLEKPEAEMTIDRAYWFFVRYRQSRQGLGKNYCTPTIRTRRGMNENVSAWLSAVDGLQEAVGRLRRVEVRCMDAVTFIGQYDHENALFYVDPPYLHSTRVTRADYEHEFTEQQHVQLLAVLSGISGKFVLSGYPSELYDQYARDCGWRTESIEIDNKASGKKEKQKKTECLWMNFRNDEVKP